MMSDSRWIWPTIIVASAVTIGVLAFFNIDSPLRPLIALWFLVVCPGMAVARLVRLHEIWTEATIAVAVSLTLDVGVSMLLVYSGYWSPNAGLAALIVISVVGAGLQVWTGASRSTDVVGAEPASSEG